MVKVTAFVVFVVGAVVTTVGCVAGAVLTSRRRRRAAARRRIERRETTAIAALREGEPAKIRGVVAAREPLVTSPISGRACIGYEAIIDDQTHNPDYTWDPLVRREAWPSFLVADETGTAAVEGPFTMLLDPHDGGEALPASAYALLKEDNVRMKDFIVADRRFWFRETLLKVGDRVSVVGRPSPLSIDPAARGTFREPPMLSVLKGSEDEPVVVIDEAGHTPA